MRALKLGAATLVLVVVAVPACVDSASAPVGPESGPATRAPAAPLLQDIPPDVGVSQGFHVTLLSGLSSFPDDVAATFRIKLDGRATTVAHARDASLVIFLEATFAEGGSNGWHTHPSPGMFAVRSGRVGLINANDCVVRIYEAGQAFMDPGQGNVHVAFNALPEGEGESVIVGGFLGVPPGEPVSTPAPDPGC
jgi:hypothetical protein